MKKRVIAVLLGACMFFTSGCMNSVRLDERVVVQAIGADRQGDAWQVTLQIYDTAKPEGSVRVTSASGNSFGGIMSDLAVREGKQMFLGDLRLAVIGSDAAAEGMDAFLNFLNTHYQISPALPLAVVQGSAEQLLRAGEKLPAATGPNMAAMLQNARKTGQSTSGTLMETIAAVKNQKVSAVLPLVTLQGAEQEERAATEGGGDSLLDELLGELTEGGQSGIQDSGAQNTAGDGEEENAPPPEQTKNEQISVQMQGVGVCIGDRLVQQLDVDTARGIGWLERGTNTISMTLNDAQIGLVSSLVQVKKSEIVPEAIGDNLVIHITLEVRSELLEQELKSGLQVQDVQGDIKRLHELVIGAQIKRALMLSGKEGCDPLGLARYTRRSEPEFYRAHAEEWEEIMRGAGYAVEVRCTLEQDSPVMWQ